MEVESPIIQITFPFEAGEPYDVFERYPFWNLPGTIQWFKNRGYTLYHCIEEGITSPSLPYEVYGEADYPYAFYDTEPYDFDEAPGVPLRADDGTGKVVYAQDSSNRHVVIKLVRADTDEYRILRFLSEQKLDLLKENCVIPVLELLPTEGYWFAVMPRWGTEICSPSLTHLCDVIDVIHCTLKGLVFLHEHNIAHGDISFGNALVNHFSDMHGLYNNETRKQLRSRRSLSYALFDFDFSIMLPAGANRQECRLPYERSWGTFNLSEDAAAGDYDYNPFIFDVGGMGVTFCHEFQGLTEAFPALAPLFDMMTTWDLRRRFTAGEALQFFETHVSELSEDQLRASIVAYPRSLEMYYQYDRWQRLPPDLVERWKMYRGTPQPWIREMLCALCRRRWWCHIVPWTRWFFYQVFSDLPRRSFRWLFPSKVQL